MTPPKGALVLVAAVGVLYALSLVATDQGADGRGGWVESLVERRPLVPDDVAPNGCPAAGGFEVPAGGSCEATVRESFRTVRELHLRLDGGQQLRVDLLPRDQGELAAFRVLLAGQTTSDLDISTNGARLLLRCTGPAHCRATLG